MRLKDLLEVYIPQLGSERALNDSDSIRVYHGTSDPDFLITSITEGVTGDKRIYKRYSYENNNNPRGFFVTPSLQTAKEFGDYVFEFHTKVSDLHAPVWPGGSFVAAGQYAPMFADENERENALLAKRRGLSSSDFEFVRDSDRPELAWSLYLSGEPQALFQGNLNPNSIRAIWISSDPGRTNKPYIRYNRKEVLDLYHTSGIPTRYGRPYKSSADRNSESARDAKRKVVAPREDVTFDSFIDALQKNRAGHLSKENLEYIVRKNPQMVRDYVWSDTQANDVMDTM